MNKGSREDESVWGGLSSSSGSSTLWAEAVQLAEREDPALYGKGHIISEETTRDKIKHGVQQFGKGRREGG